MWKKRRGHWFQQNRRGGKSNLIRFASTVSRQARIAQSHRERHVPKWWEVPRDIEQLQETVEGLRRRCERNRHSGPAERGQAQNSTRQDKEGDTTNHRLEGEDITERSRQSKSAESRLAAPSSLFSHAAASMRETNRPAFKSMPITPACSAMFHNSEQRAKALRLLEGRGGVVA